MSPAATNDVRDKASTRQLVKLNNRLIGRAATSWIEATVALLTACTPCKLNQRHYCSSHAKLLVLVLIIKVGACRCGPSSFELRSRRFSVSTYIHTAIAFHELLIFVNFGNFDI